MVLIDTVIETSDPRFCLNSYETKLSRLVAPGLTSTDNAALEPQPMLAEAWHAVDPLTWDFTLRPDATFSDGTPVTAADVAWTFSTIIAKDSHAISASQYRERFTAIEAVDPRTVRFHLVKPLATLLSDVELGVLARHAAGPDGSFPGGRVVGAGPFAVTALDQRRVVLERNARYWGTPPPMPRVELRVVRDAGARNLMLVGGSADLGQNAVRLDLLDDVARRGDLVVTSDKSAVLTYLMMNNEDPILRDVRVRQAIAYALDRRAIVEAKFSGRAVLATGLIPPGTWAYEPNVTRYDHDAARAGELLDAAGYPDPDGPGPRPRLSLVYKTSSDQFRVAVARVIGAQLGRVGIAVDVRAFEFGTFFADVKAGSYQLASMQTLDISDPDYLRTYFSSTRIPTPTDKNANNRWRFRNATFDRLVEDGRRVLDPAERKRIYGRAQQILADEVPVVFLWHEDNVVLAHRGVTGFRIVPNGRIAGLATARKDPAP